MKRVINPRPSAATELDLSTMSDAQFSQLAMLGVFTFRTRVGTVRYLRCASPPGTPGNTWGFASLLSQTGGDITGNRRVHVHRDNSMSFEAGNPMTSVNRALENGREVIYFDDAAEFCRWMADGFDKRA